MSHKSRCRVRMRAVFSRRHNAKHADRRLRYCCRDTVCAVYKDVGIAAFRREYADNAGVVRVLRSKTLNRR